MKMKRILYPIFVVLFPSVALAWGVALYSSGVIGGACASFTFTESFEGTEYDTSACGSAPCITSEDGDGDYSTVGIDMVGSECLHLDAAESLVFTIADSCELWILYKFRHNDNMENNETILDLFNGGTAGTALGYVIHEA